MGALTDMDRALDLLLMEAVETWLAGNPPLPGLEDAAFYLTRAKASAYRLAERLAKARHLCTAHDLPAQDGLAAEAVLRRKER